MESLLSQNLIIILWRVVGTGAGHKGAPGLVR